jgi:hypothetical protein
MKMIGMVCVAALATFAKIPVCATISDVCGKRLLPLRMTIC